MFRVNQSIYFFLSSANYTNVSIKIQCKFRFFYFVVAGLQREYTEIIKCDL